MTKKPNILQRLKLARRVFSDGLPPDRIPARVKQSFPLIFPDYRKKAPLHKPADYINWVQDGFNTNTLIYSAIMYKARAKGAAPLRAYKGTLEQRERLTVEHPLAALIARPNPHQSMLEMEQLNIVYKNLTGNVYMMLVRPKRGGLPEAMYSLRPDKVFIVPHPNNKEVVGYLYVPEGRSAWFAMSQNDRQSAMATGGVHLIPAQDMIHDKLPNPADPLDGLGYGAPPLCISHVADVDNAITRFLDMFFERGVMMPGILSSEIPIDDITAARLKERWQEMYGGYDNWTDIGILDNQTSYQRLGLTFDEMGFETLDERNETRILMAFGVPPILIGSRVGLNRATYSNYEQARSAFWEDVFVPDLRITESEYQYYLHSDDGAYVAYDFSEVPALIERNLQRVTAAKDLFAMGYPRDDAASIVSLPAPKSPAGDVSWMPLSLVPAGSNLLQAPEPSGDDRDDAMDAEEDERKFWQERAEKAKEKRGWTPEQKQRLGKQVDDIATSWESKFESETEQQLNDDLRELLALITVEKLKSLEQKAMVDWLSVESNWTQYLSTRAPERWRKAFLPIIRGVIANQGDEWKVALGMAFDVRNIPGEEWFADYMLQFAQPILDTTKDDIHKLISQAMENGWSIPQMEKQLGLTFERYLDPNFTLDGRGLTDEQKQWFMDRLPRYRREVIARTETMRASNAGGHQLFVDWNVPKKEWLSTSDDRTRVTHLANPPSGQVVPMDGMFNVGNCRMRYPLDYASCPNLAEIANCRCTTLPVIE